jgi:hypothetical protein
MNRKLALLVFGLTAVVAAVLVANEVRLLEHPTVPTGGWHAYLLLRAGAWVGALATLGIFSFLFRENPFYRACEHILLGTTMGFMCATLTRDTFIAKCFKPIALAVQAVWAHWHGQPAPEGADTTDLWLVFAVVVGLLWYFQLSKRYLWLSRIAVAIVVGQGAGIAFKDTFNQLMPQITESFKPLIMLAQPGDGPTTSGVAASVKSAIFLLATLSVLTYFFFAFEQRNPAVRGGARLGRWFLMVGFGAFFGNTFMSRLSALVERCKFLVEEWIGHQ